METHPTLSTGTTWTKSRLAVVGPFGKIKEIVDEVGINLHDESKEHAERSCLEIKLPSLDFS